MKKIISLLLIVSFISCNDDKNETPNLGQTETDIISYIEANNLDAERTSSGVYYVTEIKGEGKTPESDAYVKIDLKGYFLDGVVFGESDSEGGGLDLLYVIPGLADGIVNFNEGGKGTILIPPSLAYGDFGYDNIPGGAVLIFDIEIISVLNAQGEEDIIEYIEDNELEANQTESGLYYVVENLGDGDPIDENSVVELKYKGYFTNGIEFDANNSGVVMDLKTVIPGFSEGIALFNKGGKGTILIPPSLAYGEDGSANGNIPRSAVLIFDIDILE